MNMLQISGLEKRFGDKEVLRGLDLSVPEHSVFGFIGKNGAGKTTTIKMLTCLTQPTSGDAFVGGYSITKQPEQMKKLVEMVKLILLGLLRHKQIR